MKYLLEEVLIHRGGENWVLGFIDEMIDRYVFLFDIIVDVCVSVLNYGQYIGPTSRKLHYNRA